MVRFVELVYKELKMPFKSSSQRKKCFALKARGQAGSWDCDEWASATKGKKLPEKVKKPKK